MIASQFAQMHEAARHQIRLAHTLVHRQRSKHLSLTAFGCTVMIATGHLTSAVIIGSLIVLYEVINDIGRRRLPRHDRDITNDMILVFLAVVFSSSTTFMAVAVIITGTGSIALLVYALLWSAAVMMHVSNNYAQVSLFNFAQLIPAAIMAVVQFSVILTTTFEPSPRLHWVYAAIALAAFLGNTIETLNANRFTSRALALAQQQATARLQRLERLNARDTLTGLLNRTAFERALEGMLTSNPNDTTLFVIDLNGFKPINDSYGHAAGDALLAETGTRLAYAHGQPGLCARIGGDEFMFACTGLKGRQAAHDLAVTLQQQAMQPIAWDGKSLRVTASIGIAGSAENPTLRRLTAAADQAMFVSKGDPNGAPVYYCAGKVPRRASLEDRERLSDALKTGAIRPHYQPKICLQTGRTLGFEALARWHRPDGTVLSPGKFMPQIAELNLLPELLSRTAAHVMTDLDLWLDEGVDPGHISINVDDSTLATLSGRNELLDLMKRSPELAGKLVLEVTEDVFIARSGGIVRESIRELRRAGYRISLDDFGTGFASFQHLRELKLDEIKVDHSFIADLGKRPAAEVLLTSLIGIGQGMGLRVVAEGVETRAQCRKLEELGCAMGQGFLWSPAMDASAVRDWLTTPHRLAGPGYVEDASKAG